MIGIILANWRLLAIAGGVVSILVILGVVHHKIDQAAFNRCEAVYAKALEDQKAKADKQIVNTGRQYDKVKAKISSVAGDNSPVGPRITAAINGLPDTGIDGQ